MYSTINIDEVIDKLKTYFNIKCKFIDKIEFVLLHGSLAKRKFTPLSDIDLAIKPKIDSVDFTYNYVPEIVCDLSEILEVKEDLIDILVIHDDLPYELLFRIVTHGIPIYVENEENFKNFKLRVISLYLDFNIQLSKFNVIDKYLSKVLQ